MDDVVREVNARVLGKGLGQLRANGGRSKINQLLQYLQMVQQKLCRLVSEFGRVYEIKNCSECR